MKPVKSLWELAYSCSYLCNPSHPRQDINHIKPNAAALSWCSHTRRGFREVSVCLAAGIIVWGVQHHSTSFRTSRHRGQTPAQWWRGFVSVCVCVCTTALFISCTSVTRISLQSEPTSESCEWRLSDQPECDVWAKTAPTHRSDLSTVLQTPKQQEVIF